MRKFRAELVLAEELFELDTFVIVLAERSDGTGARLEVARSLSSDACDRRTGLPSCCLSTESGATFYGGGATYALENDALELRLDARASAALEVMSGYRIEITAAQAGVLRDALGRLRLAPDNHGRCDCG